MDGSQAEAIERHLLECSTCTHLATAPSCDDLIRSLQRGLSTLDDERHPTLDEVVRRCREIPVWASQVSSMSQVDQSSCTARGTSAFQAFFGPARCEGDLGSLSKYRILRELGAGSHGVVFDAIDTDLNRPVAIKIMRPERLAASPNARERFKREAQLAATLRSDHVVRIHDVSEVDGVPYLVMERLSGETLEDRVTRDGTLALEEALCVTRQILVGLSSAHQSGLLHRDIKPANIWLSEPHGKAESLAPDAVYATQAKVPQVLILDFGLARSFSQHQPLTQDGAILGTPGYWAPEQANGKPVDVRSDLFSVGCVLYHMLTGRLPFEGDDLLAYLLSLADGKWIPAAQRNPLVPIDVDPFIAKLLAKSMDDRPASADEAIAILDTQTTLSSSDPATGDGLRSRVARLFQPTRPPSVRVVASLAILSFIVWMAITRIQTQTGTIVITGVDNDVEVEVLDQDGPPRIVIVDKKGQSTLEVTPGAYELRARYRESVTFSTSKPIEVVRGETVAVRVEYLLKSVPATLEQADNQPAKIRDATKLTLAVKNILGGNFLRHYGAMYCIAITPSEPQCVTGGADGLVRLWDLNERRLIAEAEAHARITTSVAVYPRGRRLASAGVDGLVKLWKLAESTPAQLELLHTIVLPGPVSSVRFNAQGNLLAAMTRERLWIYDTETYERWASIELKPSDCNQPQGFLFLNQSDQLVVRSQRKLIFYDAQNGNSLRELATNDLEPLAVAADDSDTFLAIGMMAPQPVIQIVELATGKVIRTLPYADAEDEPISLSFAPDSKQLLAVRGRRASEAEYDPRGTNAIWQWSLEDDEQPPLIIKSPVYHSGFLTATYSRDGHRIIAGSRDVWGTIWHARSGERIPDHEPAPFTAMATTKEGAVAGGATDGRIHLFAPNQLGNQSINGSLLEGHESYIFDMDFDQSGQQLVSSSTDGTVRTWNLATRSNAWTSRQWCTGVTWFSGMHSVLTGGRWYSQVPQLLSQSSGTPLPAGSFLTDKPINSFAVLEPELMASGSAQDAVRLWNASTRESLGTLPPEATAADGGANCMAFSSTGDTLVVGYDAVAPHKQRLTLWEIASRRIVAEQDFPEGRLMSIAFHPQSHVLATGSWDIAKVHIWDAKTLRLLGERSLGPLGAGILKVAYLNEGQQLAVLVSDGRIIVLDGVAPPRATANE